jgi:hypothetical protein
MIGQTISHYKILDLAAVGCPKIAHERLPRADVILRIRHLLRGGVVYDRPDDFPL